MIIALFLLGGAADYFGLGIVVGAIVAGVVVKDIFDKAKEVGENTAKAVKAVSYGFFGVLFFLWIGMSVDLDGLFKEPKLAILLFLAAFAGKLLGIFLMVPLKKLSFKEAFAVGVGLNARLTTEIIVAKLLFDASLIDLKLFTALVAASSVSTILVPLIFAFIVLKWEKELKRGKEYGL